MFDVSLAEVGIVGVVALLVLGPAEFLNLYKSLKKTINGFKQSVNIELAKLDAEVEAESLLRVTVDDNGLPQKAYDLEKIKRKIGQ